MREATVLIIDDTPANIAVLAEYLEAHEHRIVVAQDGEEGIERAEFVQPDLILLDVMMPGIDGFETCSRLKQIDRVKNIPVIFMTALTDSANVVRGFKSGAVDYVTKPIQLDEVLARIRTHLTIQQMQFELQEKNDILQSEVDVRKKTEQDLQNLLEQLKEAHQQLLQSEKMASLGQLAAGVAHEINNPIGYVCSNFGALENYFTTLLRVITEMDKACYVETSLDCVKKQFSEIQVRADLDFLKQDFIELMRESNEGLWRVREIVQSLKDFSHVGELAPLETDLHKGIDSTLNIVKNEIKYKAEVIKDYGDIPLVKCIASQINQVFMNLLVNAAHAMSDFGCIRISTVCQTIDQKHWVAVKIQDTGSGISDEIKGRIFDPFFTTKPIGSGTGLGLSISYGIVRKHGGQLLVESEIGKGSCFTVLLPVDFYAG